MLGCHEDQQHFTSISNNIAMAIMEEKNTSQKYCVLDAPTLVTGVWV
jgi:hypothetical protein